MKNSVIIEAKSTKTLTVRVSEEDNQILQHAMDFYKKTIATKVIFEALKDAPELNAQVKQLRNENSRLHNELKK